jgi:hypothetical protein
MAIGADRGDGFVGGGRFAVFKRWVDPIRDGIAGCDGSDGRDGIGGGAARSA